MRNLPPKDWRDERIEELERLNHEQVERYEKIIREQNARIADLEERLEKALNRVQELERRLGLNSKNSSKPPSSDDQKARGKRKKRKKTARSQGAQKGHEGSHRELWPEEKVDVFQDHLPPNCSKCGLELSKEDVHKTAVRHQVFEIPPKLIECTEHRVFACKCPGCGHSTRANLPAPIKKHTWGPHLTALLATLSAVCRDTRRQLNWFVSEVLGAPSSVGSVQKYLEQASEALQPGFDEAYQAVSAHNERVGLDETGWRKGRVPHWIWVEQNSVAAVFFICKGRTKAVSKAIIGDFHDRIFTTDRYGAYAFLPSLQHQICHAHLLREFINLGARAGPLGEIGRELELLSREFQRRWAQESGDESSREACVLWIKKHVRPRWEVLLNQALAFKKQTPAWVRWLLQNKNLERSWVFLDHPGVEPTNNASERALRGPVIQRKLSWGSQSDAGIRLMERLWTIAESCRLQRKNVLDYITQALYALRNSTSPPALLTR